MLIAIPCVCLFSLSGSSSHPASPKLESNAMGQESGPTVKVVRFNPGSRLKEKRQDEELHH